MTKGTYIELILQFMSNNNHSGIDFKEPFVKPSLRYVYPFFMFLHAVVGLVGIAGNTAMVVVIARRRLYQDQTYFLMANLAFADLIKCMVVMPITLANLLLQNWLFGSFLCFFLPMMQCFPVHASMLTFLTIAIDRYRLIVHPFKSRLPVGLCVIAVWVGAVCVVLPFAIYIKYLDLAALLGEDFTGVGICYVAGERKIEQYIRAIFVTLYAMPLAVIALLYVRVSAEFKSREAPFISVHFTQNITTADPDADRGTRGGSTLMNSWSPVEPYSAGSHHQHVHSTSSTILLPRDGFAATLPTAPASRSDIPGHHAHPKHYHTSPTCSSQGDAGSVVSSSSHARVERHAHIKSCHGERGAAQVSDDELDIHKEKRTQNYLITMTTLFGMCWCPLNILILVHFFVHENDDNIGHYDITYMLFAWFGFLSTCTTPVLFASWRMSDATKDRLRGYFRFSNRLRSSNGSERQQYLSRLLADQHHHHHHHLGERMIMACRSSDHYGCDTV